MTYSPESIAENASKLPEWDLRELYSGEDSPAIDADIKLLSSRAMRFESAFKGKLSKLSTEDFGKALFEYEKINENLAKIMTYAALSKSADVSKIPFFHKVQEQIAYVSRHTVFFELELNRMYEEQLEKKYLSPKTAYYRPWIEKIRTFKNFQMEDVLEQLMLEKDITGKKSWKRLFDETVSELVFEIDGENLRLTEALEFLSDKDEEKRKKAAQEIGRILKEKSSIFALVLNVLVKDKHIEDSWRGFPSPVACRNIENRIKDETIENLIDSVKCNYKDVSHRYYLRKAELLGKENLQHWDRNASLPGDDRFYSWEDAKKIILEAYNNFSPYLYEIVKKFFDNRWIDAQVRKNKASGAFSHPAIPSLHPYMMVNYMGHTRDMMTLAHEIGHGVHQYLSNTKGYLLRETPLVFSETASLFSEMIVFRAMLSKERNIEKRKIMLAGKVESMINTIIRQTALFDFEDRIHEQRKKGEISKDKICEIWLKVQKESLGKAFVFDESYRYYWSYIPHIIHEPFYVYSYVFGDCLVNSLYAVYLDSKADLDTNFEEKYINMLKAGGSKPYDELLAPFGLDIDKPDFWHVGMSMIKGFIDELD